MTGFAEALVDALFPPSCGACQASLASLALLSDVCEEAAEPEARPGCERCGLPGQGPCPDCANLDACPEPGFDRARALWVYGGTVERALIRMKFADTPHLAVAAGLQLGEALRDGRLAPLDTNCDAVVPVPIGSARLASRGYDQAALMAARLARVIRRPAWLHALRRRRETEAQASLGHDARRQNLLDAFVASPSGSIEGASLILVDDILTTGHTAHAAAVALRLAGARRVDVLSLARATLRSLPGRSPEPVQAGHSDAV